MKGQRSRRDDREVPTQKREGEKNNPTKKILGSQSAVKMQQQMPPFGGKEITAYLFVGSSVLNSFRSRSSPVEEVGPL